VACLAAAAAAGVASPLQPPWPSSPTKRKTGRRFL
jgi:hypothetical protein